MICSNHTGLNRKMVVSLYGLLAAIAIVGRCPAAAQGQSQSALPQASGAAAKTANLRAALAAAAVADGELALAVDAEKLPLPEGGAMPRAAGPVSQAAVAFKRIIRHFGRITAVAPPTMIVLNPNPGPPNIYKNIPPRQAFIFLVANLNDAQRQQLVSDRGIGLADMTTDLQRNLFMALFPDGDIEVSPRLQPGQQPDPSASRNITDQIPQGRIRVGQAVQMEISTIGSDIGGLVPKFASAKGPHIYDFQINRLFNHEVVDGVRIRSEQPNTPKKSDLNYDASGMRLLVPLDQLKTVGDLIERIGTLTKMELYADKHYEDRTVTFVGKQQSAAAGDLLRALAYCLTGTYRRVGPAYVLTDDLPGVGTRRHRINEMEADADAQRQGPLADAEEMLQKTKAMWNRNTNWFGDPLAATPEQMQHRDDNIMGAGAISVLHVASNELTPDQQAVLEGFSDQMVKTAAAHPGQGSAGIDFDKKINFYVQPSIQLLVPNLDGPVDTDLGQWVPDMFHDTSRWRRPRNRQPQQAAPSPQSTDTGAKLADLIQPIARRAVLVHPHTTAEVDAIVDKMQHMGLNQLWLTVFSSDGARMPDSGLMFGSATHGQPDLLAYALRATHDKGIAVYAVLDLFTWGVTTPADLCDLTILGETSAQDEERRHKRDLLLAEAYGNPPAPPASGLVVSQFAPGVQQRLTAFVRRLAGIPGLAGVVWRETDPSGYHVMWQSMAVEPHAQLGYTEPARLAFLRKAHADPIDVLPHRSYGELFERANMTLPNFDNWQVDSDLSQLWNQFRAATNFDLLHSLYVAAGGDGEGDRTIYLRQRGRAFGVTWYGSWDGTEARLPTHYNDYEMAVQQQQMGRADPEVKQARSQSKLALMRLPVSNSLDERTIAKQWEEVFKNIRNNEGWDGFVLEMGEGP